MVTANGNPACKKLSVITHLLKIITTIAMLLQLLHITKKFPGVTALQNVSLSIEEGEVHALCGENGAGKSTLMNILSGNQQPTAGEIFLDNKPVIIATNGQAQRLGIAIVHQEKSLSESLNIAENIYAGRQPVNKPGFINYTQLYDQTNILLQGLGLSYLSPKTLVKNISPAQQQMIEIAKALSLRPRILILDEPTASVTEKETAILYSIIRKLKKEKTAIIYISHRLQEIFTIADKVSILKDGKFQGTKNISATNTAELIRLMVGRDIQSLPARKSKQTEKALQLENLSGKGFDNISFSVNRGEIAGIAGLMGAGRTEIAKAIFGAEPVHSGIILIHGKAVKIRSTADAIQKGIGYIAEDRKTQGAFTEMNVAENIIAANLSAATLKKIFSYSLMHSIAETFKKRLNIATPDVRQLLKFLSGGNQQKVVIAKWLLADTDILIADEPTQGVDAGARFEIYNLLQQEAAKGKAILLISSELPELLLLCDTIYVIRNGRLAACFSKEEATEEKIMHAAAAE